MANIRTVVAAFVITSGLATYTLGQAAMVRRDANLRADPSTNEAPEAKLHAGDKLTLMDPTPEHGYYQVKTASGKDGWIFSRSIRIIQSPSSSQPASDPENPITGVSLHNATTRCGVMSTMLIASS
jgi:uncharacterized protein YgiM (DUF1202 family)